MMKWACAAFLTALSGIAGADVMTEFKAQQTPEAQCTYAKTVCQQAADAMKASSSARARLAEEESSQQRTRESVEKAQADATEAEHEAMGKRNDALSLVAELRSGDSKRLDICGKDCLAIMGTRLP